MTFTCDRCSGEYEARAGSAVAHVFVKDSRCNHLEARCGHCGTMEVIFLGPHRLEDAVRTGRLEVQLSAEAPGDLRVRAERAWAAAEREADPAPGDGDPGATPLLAADGQGGADTTTVRRYDLTPRHERLLQSFGETLSNIPDDLLWDELRTDHHREHPERWTD
jgi:hypothetical protein